MGEAAKRSWRVLENLVNHTMLHLYMMCGSGEAQPVVIEPAGFMRLPLACY